MIQKIPKDFSVIEDKKLFYLYYQGIGIGANLLAMAFYCYYNDALEILQLMATQDIHHTWVFKSADDILTLFTMLTMLGE